MERLSIIQMSAKGCIDTDELALIEAARLDPGAFKELYGKYFDRIYRYIWFRVSTPEDAADLTQQVFMQAFNSLPKYQNRGLPFSAWLFRIARNKLVDASRQRRPDISWENLPEPVQPHDDLNPEGAMLQQEALNDLRRMVAQLDPEKRELLSLRFAADLSSREIAAVVGKSEAAVKKQLTRIIQTLKENTHV
jgi:RNA polymerase sigma-70 factor, ECF subfamily